MSTPEQFLSTSCDDLKSSLFHISDADFLRQCRDLAKERGEKTKVKLIDQRLRELGKTTPRKAFEQGSANLTPVPAAEVPPIIPQSLEVVPAGQISEGEMSQELSGQYKKAVGGLKDVLVFGGMMIAAETFLTREKGPGNGVKGGGLKGWIEKNCPDIHYKTAMRFKTLAEHLRTEFKLADQVDLVHLLTAPIEELPKPEQKTRTDIEKFVEGKSPRQLMLDFGYASTKKTTKTEDPPEKTPEEKFKEAMEAIHNRHENAFSALATILELGEFKALADVDLQKLNDIADAWLEKTRAWLKTPKKDRIPFAIAQEAAE